MAQIPHEKRIIILHYRFSEHLEFKQIASKLNGVTADAARKLCARAKKRANSSHFDDIIKYADPAPRSGRPRRVEPGSQLSTRIRQQVRERYPFQQQVEAANVAYHNIRKSSPKTTRPPLQELNAKQVHNICQGQTHSTADPLDSRPITRKRCLEKPPLEKLDLEDRKRYIEQILALPNDAILISCDETPLDFGGNGHTHVSAPRGVVVYANQASDPRFSKMQWDAACSDTRVKRPCLVWNRETQEQHDILSKKLENQVARLRQTVDFKRQQALIDGTPQNQLLKQSNSEIDSQNALLPPDQRAGRKRRYTPKRLFKYEVLDRDAKKGGLDFVWYAFNAYEQALFPYYRQIVGLNPGKYIAICEDNVGVHHKARRLMADQIHEFDIRFIDTPTNSPDLQPIEHLHKDQKQLLEKLRFNTTSASAAMQNFAESEMKGIWQENHLFNKKVETRMNIQYFKGLANRAKNSEPPYSNKYKDSL